jgi:hypothetical protein
MKLKHTILGLAVLATMPLMASAQSFTCITNNSGVCSSDGGAQSYLSWETNGNELTVYNSDVASNTSFISSIYFGGEGSEFTTLYQQSTGVAFESGATPAALPAGNTISFSSTSSFSSVQQGSNQDGVDAGEWISFMIPQLQQSLASSNPLTFGVHLQGIGAMDYSESLINGGGGGGGVVSVVPEPETYALLLAGLGVIGGVIRRRKQKNLAA